MAQPDVKIITTGGTIDKVYFDARSHYAVGDPQIGKILHQSNVRPSYEVETLLRKDSLDLTEADRKRIVERVREVPTPRILITHGTDTMVETARALESIPGKTIVLVGALNPARFKDSDAVFNIGFAFAAVQLLAEGVYIAMNGQVFDPARVRKNRAANQFEPLQEESASSDGRG